MRMLFYFLVATAALACNSNADNTQTNKDTTTTSSAIQPTSAPVAINNATPPLEGTYWKLVELHGSTPKGSHRKEPHIQLQAGDKRLSGTGGCNSLSGGYELLENNQIKISRIAATRMACPDAMETETALIGVLETADSYVINGDTLILHRARMAPLARFVKGQTTASASGGTELNGTWELNYIAGSKIAFEGLFPNKKPTITFNFPEEKISGNGGCNQYFGSAKAADHVIAFSEMGSTKMACPGNGEQEFLTSLRKVNRYSVSEEGKTLNLIMGDIAIMRFSKK